MTGTGKILGSVILLAGIFMVLTGFATGGLAFSLLCMLTLVAAFRVPTKKCPFCVSQINREAKVCPHCQRDLAVVDTPSKE